MRPDSPALSRLHAREFLRQHALPEKHGRGARVRDAYFRRWRPGCCSRAGRAREDAPRGAILSEAGATKGVTGLYVRLFRSLMKIQTSFRPRCRRFPRDPCHTVLGGGGPVSTSSRLQPRNRGFSRALQPAEHAVQPEKITVATSNFEDEIDTAAASARDSGRPHRLPRAPSLRDCLMSRCAGATSARTFWARDPVPF